MGLESTLKIEYYNLYKILGNTIICLRRAGKVESRKHALRDCPVTKELWHQLNWNWPYSVLYMELLYGNNSTIQCCLFVCALWEIWTERNKLVHEGQRKTGLAIIDFIRNYVQKLDGLNNSIHV
ncbi:putative protein isoform X1 [Gossypium australe]|uniref:Reverse transcriptase n=1 Tax=Gossypium australe TaxID=47621 RepID=A0A5B6W919_9ROSI|nr:putative protein isoform X1 [Gossypium australe]